MDKLSNETKTPEPHVNPSDNKDIEKDGVQSSFKDLFRFASKQDYLILALGVFLAFLNGSTLPAVHLVWGLALSAFDVRFAREEADSLIKEVLLYLVLLGITIFVGTLGSRSLLRINAQRQGYNFRRAYLTALIHKEASFYDQTNPMEASSQMENDCRVIIDTLDIGLETIVFAIGGTVIGFLIAFLEAWRISVLVLMATPIFVATAIIYQHSVRSGTNQRSEAYAKAGAIAEEAFTQIRTVVSLGGEKTEVQRYNKIIETAQKTLSRLWIFQGLSFGTIEVAYTIMLVVIFYIGSTYIEHGVINKSTGNPFTIAEIYVPILTITTSLQQLPTVAASWKGIINSKIKIKKILDIIDTTKTASTPGTEIKNFCGGVEFKGVSFAYPTCPEKKVLQDLSFRIEPNTKVAFVGESGGGKSTILQLLQKFYDPLNGSIELDGHDVKNLDAGWIRRNLAYIGQEPVLFSMSIRENLLLAKKDASDDDLMQALKRANAYNFVMEMENKLETRVGGGEGAKLSGGQKQRIAIARAILKDCRVLLLDEATSALDRLSEIEIHEALEDLSRDRTIIMIAHRLSTIQNADYIIVLDQGRVVEKGTHEELLQKKGRYYQLQAAQTGEKEANNVNEEEIMPQRSPHLDAMTSGCIDDGMKEDFNEETHLIGFSRNNLSVRTVSHKSIFHEEKDTHAYRFNFRDIKKVWTLAKSEKKLLLLGTLGSVGNAIAFSARMCIIFVIISVLLRSNDPDFRDTINSLFILAILFGILILIFVTLQISILGKASDKIIQNLRIEVFYKFLRMHIGWHDQPQNTAGNLASSLEIDTANIRQLIGTSLGIIIQILLQQVILLIIAFFSCFQLALIGMIWTPLVVLAAIKIALIDAKSDEATQEHLTKMEIIVSETLNNIKTVISLNVESEFLKEYSAIASDLQKTNLKYRMLDAFYNGGMRMLLFLLLAVNYYVGVYLYYNQGLSTARLFLASFSLSLASFYSIQLFVLMPQTGRAMYSAKKLMDHLERKSQIDIENKKFYLEKKIQGNIEFNNVSFSYPTRPAKIFQNLSFKIDAGKQIGFAGPSGCGKSTIVQLLLRFYDVDDGEILLDGVNIQKYNLRYLRNQISVVFQEPLLFNETLEYNLKYAVDGITNEEMIQACAKANALGFIQSNMNEDHNNNNAVKISNASMEDFGRVVGSKGGQLSGGQKQRIAIARAILRKPKILLLDEATSAIDTQSEALVQEAINKASQGLTAISIAHKLPTLKEMNEILVFKNGAIIERGSFEELIATKGYFYELNEKTK